MQNHAVFFDRDGTLNYDSGYVGNADLVRLYSGVPHAIRLLREKGFKIVVISNQSGIARGYFTAKEVDLVNQKINDLLETDGCGAIDAFYYCPFHPDFNSTEDCKCRKPSPLMVLKASEELNIDLNKSYFVGDSVTDIECGKNAGVKTILVKNERTEEQICNLLVECEIPGFIACDLIEASEFIIKDFPGGN
ncbi:MAG: HAD family hydrolase [Ignavibacteria bacterium]